MQDGDAVGLAATEGLCCGEGLAYMECSQNGIKKDRREQGR